MGSSFDDPRPGLGRVASLPIRSGNSHSSCADRGAAHIPRTAQNGGRTRARATTRNRVAGEAGGIVQENGSDEAVAVGDGRGGGAGGDAELGVDVGGVPADGLRADEERLADLPIRAPLGQQAQHLQLAGRQAVGGRPACCRARRAGRPRIATASATARASSTAWSSVSARPASQAASKTRASSWARAGPMARSCQALIGREGVEPEPLLPRRRRPEQPSRRFRPADRRRQARPVAQGSTRRIIGSRPRCASSMLSSEQRRRAAMVAPLMDAAGEACPGPRRARGRTDGPGDRHGLVRQRLGPLEARPARGRCPQGAERFTHPTRLAQRLPPAHAPPRRAPRLGRGHPVRRRRSPAPSSPGRRPRLHRSPWRSATLSSTSAFARASSLRHIAYWAVAARRRTRLPCRDGRHLGGRRHRPLQRSRSRPPAPGTARPRSPTAGARSVAPPVDRPLERGPHVRLLPDRLLDDPPRQLGPPGQVDEVGGVPRRVASASPLASSRSRANSRTVSSMPKRGVRARRLQAAAAGSGRPAPRPRPGRPDPSPPQTASAASSVQPPAKTARRRKRACSSGGEEVVGPGDRVAHRPQARRLVARAAGQQPQAVGQARQQRRRRAGRATRAAASSIASGSPSSRRQIAATLAAFASVRAKPGRRPAPAATKSATASVRASSSTGQRRGRRRAARAAAPGSRARPRRGGPPGWWPGP